MSFQIRKAQRGGLIPLVGFYGKSGSGKTMSALLFARGLVGPSGVIRVIDTENGRGAIFSDLIPGGYDIIQLDPPFTPERYTEAIAAAADGADVVVIDSGSHEWAGEGGVLDMHEAELERMAGNDYRRRESCKMAAWIKPKMAHKRLIERILRCKAAMVVCLRGEEKTHMAEGKGGKTAVVTDKFASPIADPRFIFEMLVNFETVAKPDSGGRMSGGFVIPRKVTHPALWDMMPGEQEQIGVKHGEAFIQWCQAPAKAAPNTAAKAQAPHEPTTEQPSKTTVKGRQAALLRELRRITEGVHGWKPADGQDAWRAAGKGKLMGWLEENGVVAAGCDLADVGEDELERIVVDATKQLKEACDR